jgi:hypothetical protein
VRTGGDCGSLNATSRSICATGVDEMPRMSGTGSTDFWGSSFSPSSTAQDPMDEVELERKLTLLRAAWAFVDRVAARVSPEMRKGVRGGGRERRNNATT